MVRMAMNSQEHVLPFPISASSSIVITSAHREKFRLQDGKFILADCFCTDRKRLSNESF